jgi:toxin CcdB
MARFDVFRSRSGEELLLDCQSDMLDYFQTRFVVPLVHDGVATRTARLHPSFTIDGQKLIMATQLASAVDRRELGTRVANLSDHHDQIVAALDVLITGF